MQSPPTLPPPKIWNVHQLDLLGMDHYFFIRGFTIFETCRQFFLKSNAFQTIFLQPFLENVTGFFIYLI